MIDGMPEDREVLPLTEKAHPQITEARATLAAPKPGCGKQERDLPPISLFIHLGVLLHISALYG